MGYKVSEVFPPKSGTWLKAADLQGRTVKVVIEAASYESCRNFDGSYENKFVLSFVGKEKKLQLNKTRARAMAMIAGDDCDHWSGVTVLLSVEPTEKGDTIAIRAVPQVVEGGDF